MSIWLYLAAAVAVVVLLNVLLVLYFVIQNAWHDQRAGDRDGG